MCIQCIAGPLLEGLGTRLGEQVIVIVAVVYVCVLSRMCVCVPVHHCVCVTVHVHRCVCTYNVTTELETLWQELLSPSAVRALEVFSTARLCTNPLAPCPLS